MKYFIHASCAFMALFVMAVCHANPSAVSSDGQTIKAGQSVYPHRGSFGCYSLGELSQASTLKAQHEGQQLYAYFKANHCGLFEGNETAKVLRTEKGDSYDALVVTLQDQPSAPHEIWVKIGDVSTTH